MATSLPETFAWFEAQPLKDRERTRICQCGTEQVIRRSRDRSRMRAAMLSLVFVDQFLHQHYGSLHPRFRECYPTPQLAHHAFHGHTSPSWLVYSQYEYDPKPDWSLIAATLRDCLDDARTWLEAESGEPKPDFWVLVRYEIKREFEWQHQDDLMAALS
ncbi:hypothetical protein [Spectribacter hydrogenoxidans]|uniref:Uncharacterized protein n=1 Tax=Spectribacter hydrogenoxidans TaxID=3075608 RepID=A0ABU3C306_9GAMM|nr:hypothetical protein [Salinisphaera sp. W335]MDT0635902.1 hypothetical protein [Salinisphaera sp. W335]